ncbi:MAG TPA: hypothetical protein VI653_08635, partial [Steroidobacteraceae bacterium]
MTAIAASATNYTSAAAVARQQRLCYLLTRSPAGSLQVAVWIGWPMGLPGQDGTHLFPLRPPVGGSDYPRYVQPNDREILRPLSSNRVDGPQPLTGPTGHGLLLQIVATGRAFWQSLRSPALRAGSPRQALFSWCTLPNGDQDLRCEVSPSTTVFLDIEPPLYIDSSTAEIGRLESPMTLELVRKYWQCTPVAPEQVAATNLQIADENAAAATTINAIAHNGVGAMRPTPFPTLQTLPLEQRPLTSLTARLVLSQGPAATLYFIYNDLPVDSRRLQNADAAVRQMMDGVLYEVPRDLALERQFRERLEQTLPASTGDREAWLQFMLNTLPALEAERWDVQVTDAFPYRLAIPDDWYGDLDTANRQGWFNLRLGVVVDGKEVNLLPALARYLQTTLANNQTPLPSDGSTQEDRPEATPPGTAPLAARPRDA